MLRAECSRVLRMGEWIAIGVFFIGVGAGAVLTAMLYVPQMVRLKIQLERSLRSAEDGFREDQSVSPQNLFKSA